MLGGLGAAGLAYLWPDGNRACSVPENGRVLHPNLCARADTPDALTNIHRLGASWVRVYGWHEHVLQPHSNLNQTLWKADDVGLNTLVNIAPTAPLPNWEIERTFKTLLLAHPSIAAVELLNEPDDVRVKRWFEQDLKTAVAFIGEAARVIWSVRPEIKIVVGAQVDPFNKFETIVKEMIAQNLDLNKFDYAAHVYQTPQAVEVAMSTVQTVLAKYDAPRPIWVTELGVNNPEGRAENLVPMLEMAFGMNRHGTMVCLHEAQGNNEWSLAPSDYHQVYEWSQEHMSKHYSFC